MKGRFLIITVVLILLVFGSGITYSYFNSRISMTSDEQNIAKFIFNAEELTALKLPLMDLKPGDSKDYLFSVSNNNLEDISSVSIGYQLFIKTYHLVPLTINLYKVTRQNEEKQETLVLNCDEDVYTRNEYNELTCSSSIMNMQYNTEILDNYKLTVSFPSEYNGYEYANLVDYIDIEINSWQIIEEQE